ncbi:regulator of microtubule dynamics protein 1-like isoform X2 [Asterias amurensis]|uniref:regulator of microtubule dynamics protein 1-like isoform X2 n=1 Tax=Asterias amurensis TaxID=7602 RepID=UPI003AB6E43B
MATSVKKFTLLRRVVTDYLQKDALRTGSFLTRWRFFVNKHSKFVALSSTASRFRLGTFLTSTLVASRGIALWSSSKPDTETPKPTMADNTDAAIMEESDKLYNENKPLEHYDFISKHKESKNVDVLWRLCRACRDKAQMTATSAADKKTLTYEALDISKRCLEINEQHFASHKWFAICISEVGDYEGIKKKVANAFIIRDHFLKAIELNPADATCYHLMGLWCFTFADMAWYQRKIATAIFGTPPTSTYEEALGYFKKAEETIPNFYSKNLLMLGKTYSKMGNKADAKVWLTKAADYSPQKDEDQEVVNEAKKLL